VPVPEDPLAVLGSGIEDGVSALAGDTVICGVNVAGAGVCTMKSKLYMACYSGLDSTLPELQLSFRRQYQCNYVKVTEEVHTVYYI
jgi:hypothetical protein